MLATAIRILVTLSLSVAIFGCGNNAPRMEIEVNVTLNGKVVPHARVSMDGEFLGETDANGQFNASMNKQPGKQVVVEATLEIAGAEVTPWRNDFTVKLPNANEVLKYVFDVDLKAEPYIVIAVQQKGAPIAGASVSVNNREIGKTDDAGGFIYKYQALKKQSATVTVTKIGYSTWKKTVDFAPGVKLPVELFKNVAVTFEALKDEYGRGAGIAGIAVSVDGKKIGTTNEAGTLVFNYASGSNKPVKVLYSAPGYLPSQWSNSMVLEGGTIVRKYFNPVTAKPIKVAFFTFGGNSPGVDLKDVAAQTQTAVRTQLFKHSVFREVPPETLNKEIKNASLNISRMTSKGWQHTRMESLIDMVVVGSVSKDASGLVVEIKFYSSSGKLIFSQLIHADDRSEINGAAREVATNVIERFPFEGTVIGLNDDRYEINLGKPYAISRGSEFELIAPVSGKPPASVVKLTVKKAGDASSFAVLDSDIAGIKIAVGERVVRRAQRESESRSGRESFMLSVKGGVGKDASPLSGVNIYLNNEWVGTTSNEGRARVAIRSGKDFNLMLYRHGYQQVLEKIRVEKGGESKQFVMTANYALFKLESNPANATVFVDGELLGKTPMLDGKQVGLGFHAIRLSAGESYRDWEAIVEFDKKIEDRTGANKIVLYKDYMKLGEAAEAKGKVEEAIAAYAATVPDHPDYSAAHHRLAQLYLDEKNDFNGAIEEFENVLSRPENEQLIFKQYAVAYTNLGHAYYEKGNNKMAENKNDAAQYYAKAAQNLKIAKQNTRFFPADEYDQAVHDTYFYLALSYQKLFMISKRANMLSDANLAWRDYFDFYPKALEGDPVFEEHRDTAKKFWNQIKNK